MADINWEQVWNNSLKNKELFPFKQESKNTIAVSCPTRFSNAGNFSVSVTPSFNKASIVLELLVFNDNVTYDDLQDDTESKEDDFNKLATNLVKYELSNRLMERFKINSSGFENDTEAENTLVDYINNKATESGRMFDDKLDELNDIADSKKEGYTRIVESIRRSRKYIFSKVESILNKNFNWKSSKNEEFDDTVASFYDVDGNLAAVVSLVDKCIVVDLADGVTSCISMLKSDEEIESELTDDINNALPLLQDNELNQLKDVVASNDMPVVADPLDESEDYLESLSRRLTKLESLYIRRKLHQH